MYLRKLVESSTITKGAFFDKKIKNEDYKREVISIGNL